ncbi:phosphatase PAP2 family protein [Paraburkholderia terrae]|uniref:phosphatase PAP2 family protein n=1 Tax=Paraburkholderia terrae TaxID=311230 RepID=UPI00296B0553|nr:phosphatase PAP2 family protein [Paraburkholderia terrae]MDW3656562.1 phosphatase PAP2 family protein [Paraburkholderia terrae]
MSVRSLAFLSRARKRLILSSALSIVSLTAHAGLDHELAYDQSGIWNRNVQLALEYSAIAIATGGALWLGNDNELGHTFWQTADSEAISAVAAQAMKYTFRRARPNSGQGPNAWFVSGGDSFPSGEVTLQASFVTPFIVNYGRRYPWVWALELLPAYDAVARMKAQAHWQTDVLAGWALGTAVGYLATTWETPIFVQILPHGLTVGFAKRF